MERCPMPLSDSLGLPDVFPHLRGCPEDELSSEALQHGYQHSEAEALGFDAKRELQLTLTDQPPGFFSPASIAYWRKALRQQLQGPSRVLAAKRKAHVLFDAPLGAGSTAVASVGALPAGPRFPQQPSRGNATREAAEAWARQQLAAPGAPPLRLLGWGGGDEAGQVPHGFPRTARIFEMLAELAPPMPRALWFLRVICLNRTRPAGWDGASEAQQRSKQLTEELLGFLDSVAPAPPAPGPAAAPAAARPPRPGQPRQQPQQPEPEEDGATSEAAGASRPQQWQFGLRLAGHCCAAGLVDAARVAEWAASSRLLLALPLAARRQVLSLLDLSLPAAQLAQQQVLSLLELCLKGAEAAGAALAAKRGRASREASEVQQGLLRATARLVELHPAAFVAADEQLLQPLCASEGGSACASGSAVQQCAEWVANARQRLSQALHARVLHWHDAKALQLLDRQLRTGSSAAAAAVALAKLLSGQPAAAAAPPALGEAVRLVCEWAVAAPAADFGAALAEAVGPPSPEGRQQGARGIAALLPERVLFALAVLQALQAQQQQEQQGEQPEEQQQKRQKQEQSQAGLDRPKQQSPAPQAHNSSSTQQSPPALQAATNAWLRTCARDPQLLQQPWRQQRVLHLVLLLAEAGLFCPEAYLRTCLATGGFQPAAVGGAVAAHGGSSPGSGGCADPSSFQLALLEQLHPLMEYPTLAGGASGISGTAGKASSTAGPSAPAWPFPRQRYAWAREAVLAQYSPAVSAKAAAASAAAAAADDLQLAAWEALLRVPTPGSSSSSSSSSDSDGETEGEVGRRPQPWQRWQNPALQALQRQLLQLLGIAPASAAAGAGAAADPGSAAAGAGAAAAAPSRSASPAADGAAAGTAVPQAQFGGLLARVRQLQPWQQRHTAGALLAAAKAFLASTDSSAGGRRSPSPAAAAAAVALGPASSGGLTPNPCWLLQLLALLRACGGHREALSFISTCLNVLQRAVAAAVRAATSGQPAQQGRPELGEALVQAQQCWQQRSCVAPGLLFALLSAHAGSLAAADIAPKLLPMLTGGLWRLQQPQHQQAAREGLAAQLELAAELLALPGNASRQWLDKMEQQHSSSHWVALLLQQRAAALKAQRGSSGGTQQQVQQAAAACLQAFLKRAQQLPAAGRGAAQGPDGSSSGGTAAPNGGQPDIAALILLAPPAAAGVDGSREAGDANADAHTSVLAAFQHSLAPAALPAVLQRLSQRVEGQGPGLQQLLLSMCPAASQALVLDPRQAHSALHHQAHLPGAAGSAASASWQLALALFASCAGSSSGGCGSGGSSSGGEALLRLNASEAMAAAVAAATPATAPCCWLLLRLLLDEQQRQGGHRLAEAERQLAARVAHEAARRPQAAAALADTLCSLSPSAAAGQQLLVEVEGMLRHPVVDLERQAAAAPAAGSKPHAAAALPPPAPAPPAFAGEQGLVEATLVCLSTGSSGERQHAFAQQLIKQLAALADVALGEPGSAAAHLAGGYAGGPHGGTAASPAAVQVSIWLRLAMLLPLLPLVYKHRSADASGGLRGQLLRALLRLLAAPGVHADAAAAAAGSVGTVGGRVAATAAAAAAAAGEPLPQRLLHLLRALVVGGWASWMRLEGGKLRDVPAYEHSRQLAAEASALPLLPRLQAAVAATLPLSQQQGLAGVATCQASAGDAAAADAVTAGAPGAPDQRGGTSGSGGRAGPGQLSLDPWLLLEGGTAGGSAGAAVNTADGLPLQPGIAAAAAAQASAPPPWLEGAVKRRRRDLAYMPHPGPCAQAAPTIEEQLGRRGGGRDSGAGAGAAGAAGAAALLDRGGSVDLTAGLFAW
ncbi:hypothetical protein ABPG75_013171 [Micractinium tetrahymenae]